MQYGKTTKNTAHGRDLGYGAANGKMLRNQLASVRRSATSLRNALNDYDQVPSWVLSKSAVALSDLQAAESYILSKLEGYNKNPAYKANKAEKAKGFGAFMKRVAKAFGSGAKKAAVATAHMTKVSTLKAKILSEKNYVKTLLKYGKDLEVSEAKVKETKAYKKAKERISDYEDRIDQLEKDYKASKSKKNPAKKRANKREKVKNDLTPALIRRIEEANYYIGYAKDLGLSIRLPRRWSTYGVKQPRYYKPYSMKIGAKGKVVSYRTSIGTDKFYLNDRRLPLTAKRLRGAISGEIRAIKSAAKKKGYSIPDYKTTQELKRIYGYNTNPAKKRAKKKGLKPALQRRIDEANYYIDYANKHSLLVYDKSSTWPIRIEPQRITVSPTGSVVTVTYMEGRNDRWSKVKKKVEKYRTSNDQDVSDLRYEISLFIRSIKSAAKDEGRTVPDYKKAQEIKGIYGYKKNSGKKMEYMKKTYKDILKESDRLSSGNVYAPDFDGYRRMLLKDIDTLMRLQWRVKGLTSNEVTKLKSLKRYWLEEYQFYMPPSPNPRLVKNGNHEVQPRGLPYIKTLAIVDGDQTADPREQAYLKETYTVFLGHDDSNWDYWGDPSSGRVIAVGVKHGAGSSRYGDVWHWNTIVNMGNPKNLTWAGANWSKYLKLYAADPQAPSDYGFSNPRRKNSMKRRRNGTQYSWDRYIDFLYDDIQDDVAGEKFEHDEAVYDALQDWVETPAFQKMIREVQKKETTAGNVYATYGQMDTWWEEEYAHLLDYDIEELYALAFMSMRGDGMGLWEDRRPWHSYFEKYLQSRADYMTKFYALEEAASDAQTELDEE